MTSDDSRGPDSDSGAGPETEQPSREPIVPLAYNFASALDRGMARDMEQKMVAASFLGGCLGGHVDEFDDRLSALLDEEPGHPAPLLAVLRAMDPEGAEGAMPASALQEERMTPPASERGAEEDGPVDDAAAPALPALPMGPHSGMRAQTLNRLALLLDSAGVDVDRRMRVAAMMGRLLSGRADEFDRRYAALLEAEPNHPGPAQAIVGAILFEELALSDPEAAILALGGDEALYESDDDTGLAAPDEAPPRL